MKKSELLARIKALEAKVRSLEAGQPFPFTYTGPLSQCKTVVANAPGIVTSGYAWAERGKPLG